MFRFSTADSDGRLVVGRGTLLVWKSDVKGADKFTVAG